MCGDIQIEIAKLGGWLFVFFAIHLHKNVLVVTVGAEWQPKK